MHSHTIRAATVTHPRMIVSISCHDLGRHLGCYGVSSVTSPNLDGLAREGARLDRAFCAAPQCSPSRAALATGRYPHSNGVMGLTHGGFDWDLHSQECHVASLFSSNNHATHLFGLQHVTPNPERLGFDEIHGPRSGTGEQVAEDFAQWLSSLKTSAPAYVEVNLLEPHRPYGPPGVRPDTSRPLHIPRYLPQSPESHEEMAALQGAIETTDHNVGRILEAIDGAGVMDEALILFTADHGIAMPRAKCTLYDPGIEVALIVRWPAGGIQPGARSELVANVDVLPTLLESAGVAAPGNLQGRSFLPLIQGRRYEPRAEIYAEKTFHSYYDPMRAVRTDRHKLIWNFESAFAVEVPADVQQGAIFRSSPRRYSHDRSDPVELYDLHVDPLESNNLADDSRYAELVEDLTDRLYRWMKNTGDPLLAGPISSPHRRRLTITETKSTSS